MTRNTTPIRLALYASAYTWLTSDTEVEFPAHTRFDRLNAAAKVLGLPDMGVAWLSRGGVYRFTRDGVVEKVGHQVGYLGQGGTPTVPSAASRAHQRRVSTGRNRPRRVRAPMLAYTCDDKSSGGSTE